MAWNKVALSAADQAYHNDNKPFLSATRGPDAIDTVTTEDPQWNNVGDMTLPDDNDSDYPAERAIDRNALARTRPATNWTATSIYFCLEIPSGLVANLDHVAIIGHNFDTEPNVTQVKVQIDDFPDFQNNVGSTLKDLCTWTAPFDSGRLVCTELDGGINKFELVTNIRIEITVGAGNHKPEIGEFWFGTRRQLPHWPRNPWDIHHKGLSSREQFRSEAGAVSTYARHVGRGDLTMNMRFATEANADILRGAWSDLNYGSHNGLLVPRPDSTPQDARIMSFPPPGLLNAQTQNPALALYSLPMEEVAPFVGPEGV